MGNDKSAGVSVGVTGDADASEVNDDVATSHSHTNPSFLIAPPRHCHPRECGDRFPDPHSFVLDYPFQLLFQGG